MRIRAVFTVGALLAGVVLPAGLSGPAHADVIAPGVPVGSFTIAGSVSRPVTLTVAELAQFPSHEVTATFGSASGQRTHTYRGPLLSDVLAFARPVLPTGTPNPSLRMVATFVADDGYEVSLGWGEFDPAAGGRPILLAYWMDGQSLNGAGPRLALPGDGRGGRYEDSIRTITISQQPFAAAQPGQSGDLQVIGACCVNSPTTLHWSDLQALPQSDAANTQTVTYKGANDPAPRAHQVHGPLLSDVIQAAGGLKIPPNTKNGMLRFAMAAASATEEAAIDWGQVDPEGAGVPVLVVLTEDGNSLQQSGARLVVPTDVAGGRDILGLATVTVTAPDPSTAVPPGLADRGVRVVTATGVITSEGGASSRGDLSGKTVTAPIVAADTAAVPDGYWLAASDGGVFNFGGAPFLGSLGGMRLNQPVVGIAGTQSGKGYWLAANDGGVFAFGDAGFAGSLGSLRLNQPIVAIVATPTGRGYWLVAADGGVFAFGDAPFLGSMGGTPLAQPIVAAAATPSGQGYWLLGTDGGVFALGDAVYAGRDLAPGDAIRIVPSEAGAGYRIVHSNATVTSHGAVPTLAKTSAPAKVVAATP